MPKIFRIPQLCVTQSHDFSLHQACKSFCLMTGLVIGMAGIIAVNAPQAKAQESLISNVNQDVDDLEAPPNLSYFLAIEREEADDIIKEASNLEFDIRRDALKEAAISLGARGGLAWRTHQIRQSLISRSAHLNKVFDFRQLLIPAPSGLLIEPPIISEALDNTIIDNGGTEAAVADQIFNIGVNARIVSSARTWNQYLERTFGDVELPPQILRPENAEERAIWKKWIKVGWKNGVEQADSIFEDDLARLNADFDGMIRYRKLLAQGMISAPYALQSDRGVTGGGSLMRIGDRSVRLTGLSQLKPGYEEWRPASR